MKKTLVIILAALVALSATAVAADSSAAATSAQVFGSKKPKAEAKEVTFKVNLHCQSCVKKVQENISFEKGVKGLHVCLEDQVISIKYDPAKTNEETLKNAIVKLGVPVLGIAENGHQHNK